MKNLFLLTVLFISFFSSLSHAHNRVGNGGGAWVCRNSSHTIEWLQLIDLFEATSIYGETLKSSDGNYQEMATHAAQGLLSLPNSPLHGLDSYIAAVGNLQESSKITYVDEALPIINDALYFSIPLSSKCLNGSLRYEQIVNYKNDKAIYVNRELFSTLNPQNKAALILHEAVYAYRRDQGDTDSLNSRRIVGLAFSEKSPLLISWYLRFLENGSGPVAPKGYEVTVTKINNDGSSQPIPHAMITLKAPLQENSGAQSSFTGITNSTGQILIDVDGTDGFHTVSPHLTLEVGGFSYIGVLAATGWSKSLHSFARPTAPLNCQSVTMIASKSSHIICIDNPMP